MLQCVCKDVLLSLCSCSLLLKNAYDPHLYSDLDLQSRWNTVCVGVINSKLHYLLLLIFLTCVCGVCMGGWVRACVWVGACMHVGVCVLAHACSCVFNNE